MHAQSHQQGRILNRSAALAARRAEMAQHESERAGMSSIYDWTTSLATPTRQLRAFDDAVSDLHDAVARGNHAVWGDPLPAHLAEVEAA